MARGLVARGYLISDGGQYRIGPAPTALLAPSRPPLLQLARRPMELLRDRCDETVSLSELVGDTYVYVAMVESSREIHFSAPLGRRSELYPWGPGKVYLASMSQRRRHSYFRAHLDGRFDVDHVVADLAEVRCRGYSTNREEPVPGLSAVAAGVVIVGHVKSTVDRRPESANGVVAGTRWAALYATPRPASLRNSFDFGGDVPVADECLVRRRPPNALASRAP